MKFFLWFSTGKYEGQTLEQFDKIDELLDFVNARVDNPDFRFRVVEGREITLKPVSIVTQYVRE